MKKLLLLALVMLGGVVNVSADDVWSLRGSFNSWDEDDNIFTAGSTSVSLSEGTYYTFKLVKKNGETKTWYGNGGTINCYSFADSGTWTFSTSDGNCSILSADAGTYTFNLTIDGGTPKLSVTYPAATNRKVYLYNNFTDPTWSQPYVYMLTGSYWDTSDDDKGSGSSGQPNGIKMTQVDDTKVWEATYRYSGSAYLCFLKDKQDNYGNFWGTEGIYRADYDNNSKVFVPNPSGSTETKNTVKYYREGAWHPFPTYTRSVTDGNYGTICLPFAATVEGATIYKITSTVGTAPSITGINIETVEGNAIEAGKAYIFKATGSTLTATMSGNYADATAGYGMMGNLGSSAINVPVGNYVISGNQIHKVVSGGSGVTIGQYKGYITLTDIPSAARGANFISFENETTGINSMDNGQLMMDNYYDLQGRRVAQPTKGLYIVNGKKVIK